VGHNRLAKTAAFVPDGDEIGGWLDCLSFWLYFSDKSFRRVNCEHVTGISRRRASRPTWGIASLRQLLDQLQLVPSGGDSGPRDSFERRLVAVYHRSNYGLLETFALTETAGCIRHGKKATVRIVPN
jgi:hypothetical protein